MPEERRGRDARKAARPMIEDIVREGCVCEVWFESREGDLIAGMGWLLRGLDELTKLGVPLRCDGLMLGGAGQGCTDYIVF
jgi:hypothetical protein